jgi:hypothetical protein
MSDGQWLMYKIEKNRKYSERRRWDGGLSCNEKENGQNNENRSKSHAAKVVFLEAAVRRTKISMSVKSSFHNNPPPTLRLNTCWSRRSRFFVVNPLLLRPTSLLKLKLSCFAEKRMSFGRCARAAFSVWFKILPARVQL